MKQRQGVLIPGSARYEGKRANVVQDAHAYSAVARRREVPGRPLRRSRRSNVTWLLVSAACALIASSGVAPAAARPSWRLLGWRHREHVAERANDVKQAIPLLASRVDIVLVGTVVDVQSTPTGPGDRSGIHSRVFLTDVQVLKGKDADQFWVHGGVVGERARRLIGQAQVRKGERALLFLREDARGNRWLSHARPAFQNDGGSTSLTMALGMAEGVAVE